MLVWVMEQNQGCAGRRSGTCLGAGLPAGAAVSQGNMCASRHLTQINSLISARLHEQNKWSLELDTILVPLRILMLRAVKCAFKTAPRYSALSAGEWAPRSPNTSPYLWLDVA